MELVTQTPEAPPLADTLLIVEARDAAASGRGRRLRQAAGLSQPELAAAVGVSTPLVSRWEAGARRPRGNSAIRYAQLLRALAATLSSEQP
jgi:transcriptional regulator with XRE-family HTH domain